MSPLQKDKGCISSAAKAEMEEEKIQDESEETVVSHLSLRPRKTTKSSGEFQKLSGMGLTCFVLGLKKIKAVS